MAKKYPMVGGAGGVLSKLIGTAITIAVLVFVVKHPAEAAQWVSNIFGMLATAIDGLAAFLGQVHG